MRWPRWWPKSRLEREAEAVLDAVGAEPAVEWQGTEWVPTMMSARMETLIRLNLLAADTKLINCRCRTKEVSDGG